MPSNPKIPPHSIDAEQSVLGAIMIDREAIVEVAGFLRPEHFYDHINGDIFSAMLSLFEEGRPLDLVTLKEKLKEHKKLKEVGGAGYLSDLVNKVPTSAHVEQYGKIVKDHFSKRQLIKAAAQLTENSFDDAQQLREVLDKAEQQIFSISQESLQRNFVSMKEILATSFDRLDELQKKGASGYRGVPTGFKDVDNLLAGMQDGNLLILAARPGTGKTAIVLNMALHIAVKTQMPVGFFSLEMSQEELGDRLLVSQADVDAWKLKSGRLEDEDFDHLQDAMGVLAEAPIYIDDTPGITIMEMRTKARRLQMEKGLKLLVVDYLQLIDSGKHYENRVQEVSYISQALKNMARELKIPVLCVSQLSRAVEVRGTKIPQLSDLRESGCLTGETLILNVENGQLVEIKSLVDQPPITVLALDENYKISQHKMVKVFRSGIKKVYRLKFSSGREIRASANHPFRALYGWKRLDNLKVGERIAVPRNIMPISKFTKYDENKLLILAHMIGDGCYIKHQPIHYTSGNWENINAVNNAAKTAFKVEGKIIKQDNWWHVYLTNGGDNPIIEWLKSCKIFNQHSYDKFIPDFVFGLSISQQAFFLRHLWSTDGNLSKVGKNAMAIYYASTSNTLAYQVQHLLLRLGIIARIRKTSKKGYRGGFTVNICGKNEQSKFLQTVGVFAKDKECAEGLIRLSKLKENPNVDVIPKEIWQEIEKLRIEKGLTTREFHKLLGWAYSGTRRQGNGISRNRLTHILEVISSPFIKDLAESDVFWDEVLEIIPEGKEEVFDATVEGAHNFLANDIIVHNSIEQDADVVMFLYRPDEENADPNKIFTKLSVAKHRNGALGEFDFMFVGAKLRFYLQDHKRT